MPKLIRVQIDKRKKFGAFAAPGKLVFGTQTHLLTKPEKRPTIELLISQAQSIVRERKTARIAAEKIDKNSIKAKISKLRHLEAVGELHQHHRAMALEEYNALQRKLKGKTTTDPREFMEEKNAIYTLSKRVRFIDELIDRNQREAQRTREEVTGLLSLPVKVKAKAAEERAQAKQMLEELSAAEKNDLDKMLDGLNDRKKARKELVEELKRTAPGKTAKIESIKRHIKEIEIDLIYMLEIIRTMSKPKERKRTKKTRLDNARDRE